MGFKWKQIDSVKLYLIGYENIIVATVYWEPDIQRWHLESLYYDHCLCEDLDLKDIEDVKSEAIKVLKNACEGHIAWYRGQIEELERVT